MKNAYYLFASMPVGRAGILLFCFSIVYGKIAAQVELNIDSLQNELSISNSERHQADILNQISFSYIKKMQHQSALPFAQRALTICENIGYEHGRADAFLNLGLIDVSEKKLEAAKEKYTQSYDYYNHHRDTLGLARYYHKYGHLHSIQRNGPDGLNFSKESIKYYKIAAIMYEAVAKNNKQETDFYLFHEYSSISNHSLWLDDMRTAEEYAQKALAFAEKNGSPGQLFEAYAAIAQNRYNYNRWQEAIPYFEKVFKCMKNFKPRNEKDELNCLIMYYQAGICYGQGMNMMDEAIKYYTLAADGFEQKDELLHAAWTYYEMSVDLNSNERFSEALTAAQRALDLGIKIDDRPTIAAAHRAIGGILLKNKNLVEAEKHLNKSLEILRETQVGTELGSTLHEIGTLESNKGNKDEAIKIFMQIDSLATAISDTHLLTVGYTNLILLGMELHDYEKAKKCFTAVIEKEESRGDNPHIMDHYRFAGICYAKAGDDVIAEKYLMKSVELANIFGNDRGMTYAYNLLHEIKFRQKDFEKALFYKNFQVALLDSIANRDNLIILADMQTKYATEKKEKEIIRLQSEQQINLLDLLLRDESLRRSAIENEKMNLKNQNYEQTIGILGRDQRIRLYEMDSIKSKAEGDSMAMQLVYKDADVQRMEAKKQKLIKNLAFSGFGIFLVLTFFAYNNHTTRQQLKLQTLRNKIASDLHDDVGSTLSSIHIFSEMARNQSKEVLPMLDTISESSKKMMDAMADIVWTINPENDNFEKIMDRMRSFAYELLLARKIDFEFDAKESLNDLKLSMEARKNLYLIFKEATNNMVKYSNADKAHFSLTEADKMLTMIIEDNGKGFDTQITSSGNGLKNMKKRAEEIGGAFRIDSAPGGGTTIQLKIAV